MLDFTFSYINNTNMIFFFIFALSLSYHIIHMKEQSFDGNFNALKCI